MWRKIFFIILLSSLLFANSAMAAQETVSYQPTGVYLYFDNSNIMDITERVKPDENGIPLIKRYDLGWQYNPTTITQYGLEQYSKYIKTKDIKCKENAIKVADWLVNNQTEEGTWKYDFKWNYRNANEILEPGWISGLAQGQAISLLSRIYTLSGDRKYLKAAENALIPFTKRVEDGGIVRYWENEYIFFEEYPTKTPSYVLNGFIFALIGLYDMHQNTGNILARQLYENGEETLRHIAPMYDLATTTSYDLVHFVKPSSAPNAVKANYHSLHVKLMNYMFEITTDPLYKTLHDRWQTYAPPK